MATISGTSDLTSYLQTFPQYRNSTYTARHPSSIYTIGFTSQIQVLNAPLYIGIRDIGGYVEGLLPYSSYDLSAFIRSTIQSAQNLGAYSKGFFPAEKDLGAGIHSWRTKDLSAYIGMHLPVDLAAILKVISVGSKDLPGTIIVDLYKGIADLGGIVSKIFLKSYKNLSAFISSPLVIVDLPASVGVVSIADLPTVVKAYMATYVNLGAYLNAGLWANLGGIVQGWALTDLPAAVSGVYGPNDLQAYLRVHPYLNLPSTVYGWYSSIINLPAILNGWQSLDLTALINAVSAVDLRAYLAVSSYSATFSLGASIVPKTIQIKLAVLVALLEHKDLTGIINIGCFGTDSKDLAAYLTIQNKSDLMATIWGARPLDFYKDLVSCINTSNYVVENKYTIRFIPYPHAYSILRLKFSIAEGNYFVMNTLPLIFGVHYGANLGASITAIAQYANLSATITALVQADYSELPDYINPKTHAVVIDFSDHGIENWRRFVEIMFLKDGVEPFHYFYVSGANKIYRLDKTRHWTVWVKSYRETTDDLIERRDTRNKYFFNLNKYSSIDEAVTDFIDRVSDYRKANLAASITCVASRDVFLRSPVEYQNKNLESQVGKKRSWVRSLRAIITPI